MEHVDGSRPRRAEQGTCLVPSRTGLAHPRTAAWPCVDHGVQEGEAYLLGRWDPLPLTIFRPQEVRHLSELRRAVLGSIGDVTLSQLPVDGVHELFAFVDGAGVPVGKTQHTGTVVRERAGRELVG